MKKLPRKFRDPLIFLCILIAVPGSIYFISMNFGDQRVHIEKKQWNPAAAADQGVNPHRLKKADEHIEARLPLARGMVIIKNGKTIHEKYYWKGGPLEKEFLHFRTSSLNGNIGVASIYRLRNEQYGMKKDDDLREFYSLSFTPNTLKLIRIPR